MKANFLKSHHTRRWSVWLATSTALLATVVACQPSTDRTVENHSQQSAPAQAGRSASGSTGKAPKAGTRAHEAADPEFAREFHDHIAYLASDSLEGRGTGAKGNDLAAEYIAQQFKLAGLEPAGEGGTFFQPFDVTLSQKLTGRPSLFISNGPGMGILYTSFVPLPFSAIDSFDGRVAFAGYGIVNEEAKYDDYADFDAKNKVLLILRYEPHDSDPKAKFGGQSPSTSASFQSKARIAREHGAAALLIVNPPLHHAEQDKLFPFDSVDDVQSFDIPMIHVSRDLAAGMLRAAGAADLKTLQTQLDTDRKPHSFDLKRIKARGTPGLVREKAITRNVIGRIPGSGSLADQYVVIGAHYDHLGIAIPRGTHASTKPSDPHAVSAASMPAVKPEIHNGADDNASGDAGLILLAEMFGQGAKGEQDRAGESLPPLTSRRLAVARGGQGGSEGRKTPSQSAAADDDWQSRFDRIKVGMLKQKVESILGTPTDPLSSPERGSGYGPAPMIESSESPSDISRIRIHYSAEDKVTSKKIYSRSARKRQVHEKTSGNRRGLLFIAFSGEEIGLLGSMYFVNHPTLPLDRIVAMLNMDMIGRLRENRLQVFGIKTAPIFEDLIKGYAQKFGFSLQTSAGGFGPSDHTSFYTKKIPVLHFFTGIHNDYHRPTDDVDLINAEGGARVVEMVAAVAADLREVPEPPAYVAVPDTHGSRTGLKVRMGLMPSYAEDQNPGLQLDGVSPGSPAEKAGLKSGDRLLMIGTYSVNNVYDLMDAMGHYEPGNEANLTVLRGGQRVQMAVRFEAP